MDIVMLDEETAIVSWLEQTPGGAELRARRVRRNLKADPSIKVADTTTARAAGFARMATAGGDVYVAWTEHNAVSKKVHVARIRF